MDEGWSSRTCHLAREDTDSLLVDTGSAAVIGRLVNRVNVGKMSRSTASATKTLSLGLSGVGQGSAGLNCVLNKREYKEVSSMLKMTLQGAICSFPQLRGYHEIKYSTILRKT